MKKVLKFSVITLVAIAVVVAVALTYISFALPNVGEATNFESSNYKRKSGSWTLFGQPCDDVRRLPCSKRLYFIFSPAKAGYRICGW